MGETVISWRAGHFGHFSAKSPCRTFFPVSFGTQSSIQSQFHPEEQPTANRGSPAPFAENYSSLPHTYFMGQNADFRPQPQAGEYLP
jgi:hypothetical protein